MGGSETEGLSAIGDEGKLQYHSRLTLMAQVWFLAGIRCAFTSLKVCNVKVCMYGTYCRAGKQHTRWALDSCFLYKEGCGSKAEVWGPYALSGFLADVSCGPTVITPKKAGVGSKRLLSHRPTYLGEEDLSNRKWRCALN